MNFEENKQEESQVKRPKKHLIFLVGNKRYALPLNQIKEVIRMTNITSLPSVDKFYEGLINIRGQIISVINLQTLLGTKEEGSSGNRNAIIVAFVGDILVGMVVGTVLEVRAYYEKDLDISESGKMDIAGTGVYGVAKDEGSDLTLLLSIEKALEGTEFFTMDQHSRDQDQNKTA